MNTCTSINLHMLLTHFDNLYLFGSNTNAYIFENPNNIFQKNENLSSVREIR